MVKRRPKSNRVQATPWRKWITERKWCRLSFVPSFSSIGVLPLYEEMKRCLGSRGSEIAQDEPLSIADCLRSVRAYHGKRASLQNDLIMTFLVMIGASDTKSRMLSERHQCLWFERIAVPPIVPDKSSLSFSASNVIRSGRIIDNMEFSSLFHVYFCLFAFCLSSFDRVRNSSAFIYVKRGTTCTHRTIAAVRSRPSSNPSKIVHWKRSHA